MNIETLNNNSNNKHINKTLQGVLVNSHLRTPAVEKYTFDDIQDSLLINNSEKYYSHTIDNKNSSVFDTKKAVMPLTIGTMGLVGGCLAFSTYLRKSSKNLLNTKNFEHLPDLAINMNIREEPQFAIYRAIRDPNFRNIMGTIGVILMSGIAIGCKNFVDGMKEIWVKKRSADIEKNLQENLISVDRDTFSGKLKVINDLMNKNIKYFDEAINSTSDIASFSREKPTNVFDKFTSFKGENKQKQENLKYVLLGLGVLAGSLIAGKLSYSNLKKALENTQNFGNNFTQQTIDAIETISSRRNEQDIGNIIELMKSICVKPEYIRQIGKKYNLKEEKIQEIINLVEESKKTIFADAPTALGGIPKKVQYYCYIDEPRGHFYNWILNPENKFTKYIFGAFTLSSALGYVFEQGMDALKEVTVKNENAKTDLDLKKRLVAVEIESFRAKKESAAAPLIDDFTKQVHEGKKTKQQLKQIADNILMEIKNGPPYVYN